MKSWIFSDSHSHHGFINVPKDIDLAIFAGDCGTVRDPYMNANGVRDFLEWYNSLEIKFKIFVAGNHDTSIERGLVDPKQYPSIIWLNHESTVIEGIKIFGSPFQPSFGDGWAYNVKRAKLHDYWKDIPTDTDILITHGPPYGILDLTESGEAKLQHVGCSSLFKRIKAIEPKFSIFGHIHNESEGINSGIFKPTGMKTTFINACVVDLRYELVNDGIVIEI